MALIAVAAGSRDGVVADASVAPDDGGAVGSADDCDEELAHAPRNATESAASGHAIANGRRVRPTLRVRPSIDGDGTRAADGMDRGC
jgi:hypothetical protein